MTPQEARKLLGGFATGTLTPSEEQALFAAALLDQTLFEELAREQTLRELLQDPAAKARLLAALEERPRAWWLSWKPAAVLAMAGVTALAVVIGTRKDPPRPELLAKVEVPAAVSVPRAPAASDEAREKAAPQPEPKRANAPRTFSDPPGDVGAPKAELQPAPVRLSETASPQAQNATERDMAAAGGALPDRAPPPGGVIGGVVGGVPGAAPPPPAPARQERAAAAPKPSASAAETEPSARAMFTTGAAPMARMQAIRAETGAGRAIGVRYSIVRSEGEAATIRFTANVNGYLSINGATPVALTAMRPYMSPPVEGDEVKVVFAREPRTSAEPAAGATTEAAAGETYVANPEGGAFAFTIPLRPR